MIDPKEMMRRHSVEELCETAENYYRLVSDPAPLMSKPFTFFHEAPDMLQNMGLLLSGLNLGKTMKVLDFGAGTCWLSRFLTQLQCQMFCCDASKTALEIGKSLFEKHPLIGHAVFKPTFLWFNGHRIELPDRSMDRIVCFDAFHHVPNTAEVLFEFGRVLKPGGIAGFSEPGRRHSQTPQSQYEMKNHNVLENDIDIDEIFALARGAGFTDMSVKLVCDMNLSRDDYDLFFRESGQDRLKSDLWNNTVNTLSNRTIFFLHKGPFVPDSRSHVGLAHSMELEEKEYSVDKGRKLTLSFKITNTGSAAWLNTNSEIFGIVRLASHLYDDEGRVLNLDYSRDDLPGPVNPGETIFVKINVALPDRGSYRLVFDLVAEGVIWFENAGSKPVAVAVRVQ